MVSMERLIQFLLFISLGLFCHASRGDIVYQIQPQTGFSGAGWEILGGTITTDGSLGEITDANIVHWNINYLSSIRLISLTPQNSLVRLFQNNVGGLTATPTELLMAGVPANIVGFNEQLQIVDQIGSFQYGVVYIATEQVDFGGVILFDSTATPQNSSFSVPNSTSILIGTAVPEPNGLLIASITFVFGLSSRIRRLATETPLKLVAGIFYVLRFLFHSRCR